MGPGIHSSSKRAHDLLGSPPNCLQLTSRQRELEGVTWEETVSGIVDRISRQQSSQLAINPYYTHRRYCCKRLTTIPVPDLGLKPQVFYAATVVTKAI